MSGNDAPEAGASPLVFRQETKYGGFVIDDDDVDDAVLDELLRALAHPARRAIVSSCRGDWVAAGTLTDQLGLAPATVSEHLKVLRKVGLVELQTDGRWRRYRSRPAHVENAISALRRATQPQRKALR
jgi:DNA-binding transcriptional ArsR family regulator